MSNIIYIAYLISLIKLLFFIRKHNMLNEKFIFRNYWRLHFKMKHFHILFSFTDFWNTPTCDPFLIGNEPIILGTEPIILGNEPITLGTEPVFLGNEPNPWNWVNILNSIYYCFMSDHSVFITQNTVLSSVNYFTLLATLKCYWEICPEQSHYADN